MTVLCTDCQAKHSEAENSSTHPGRFTPCCNLGGRRLQLFEGYPDTLRHLMVINPSATRELRRLQRNLHQNVRKFKSSLAMKEITPPRGPGPYCFRIHDQTYHCIGPLHPEEGQLRQHGCDAGIMMTLTRLISEINPYAQAFKMHEVEMLGEGEKFSRCRYDVPTMNEMAVVYIAEDAGVPASRSSAVHQTERTLQQLAEIDSFQLEKTVGTST
ncbi:unnamed protein product [Heligmosomoides polygyrus]|uniref:Helitron_like_N domain-containing protein n=1 Tax=Heligmosomoides polygyrus TaxID=6339 RepID=A0A183F409_HELPZ|nr:unnamed protein product [Heligmosomoides polygyrus]